jgi:hypothetical protein
MPLAYTLTVVNMDVVINRRQSLEQIMELLFFMEGTVYEMGFDKGARGYSALSPATCKHFAIKTFTQGWTVYCA